MKVNLSNFRSKSKYINEQLNEETGLILWNYTPECQFDGAWDEDTVLCRGLVTDQEGNVIAKPFSKFFNVNEREETKIENLPAESPHIYEKLDGSLAIVFSYNQKLHVATRGSWKSEQAIWAKQWLDERFRWSDFAPEYTYLMEIIYPQNRVVVNYGDRSELVLIGVIVTATGEDLTHEFLYHYGEKLNLTTPKRYDHRLVDMYEKLDQLDATEEGYAVLYPSTGFRVKMKGTEYVRLHKIITGLSQIGIWEALSTGTKLELDNIPDELYRWIKDIESELEYKWSELKVKALDAYEEITNDKNFVLPLDSRKKQAIHIMNNYRDISGLVFGLLDGRDISPMIWKMIRPKGKTLFKNNIDL